MLSKLSRQFENIVSACLGVCLRYLKMRLTFKKSETMLNEVDVTNSNIISPLVQTCKKKKKKKPHLVKQLKAF
jgi:hypothetical protein